MLLKTQLLSLIGRHTKVRPARLSGRAVASIAFDDFPRSAWTEGGPVLARHGARGTYYTAGSFCGRNVEGTRFYDGDDLRALAAAGHEIGCHGFGHQPVSMLTPEALAQDFQRNQEFLRPFLNGAAPDSYAFPFGRVSPATKRFFAPRFSSLRGTHSAVNSGAVDLAQLSVISLESRCWNEAAIQAALDKAVAEGGWIILYTHGVTASPGLYDSSPAMLDWALGRAVTAGLPILPVREALPLALGR